MFNCEKFEVVNPWNWNSENSRVQTESITLVKARQVKRDRGNGSWHTGISLDVEMDVFRLDVHDADNLL